MPHLGHPPSPTPPSGGSPLTRTDEHGTDWQTGSYLGDVWLTFKGEMSALNPINWVKSIYAAGSHLNQHGWSGRAWGDVASNYIDGMQFWNKTDDLYGMGNSFMGDVITFTPLIAKVPNPTSWTLKGPFLSGKGLTIIRAEKGGSVFTHDWRIDIGPLPDKPSIPSGLRGKTLPHYHSRGAGGIEMHRPWERKGGGSGQ